MQALLYANKGLLYQFPLSAERADQPLARLPLTRGLLALVPEGQHVRFAVILAMLHMLFEYIPFLKFAMIVAAGY